MAGYDCVLYDFDGTLADSVPLIIKNQVMAYEKVIGRCDRTEEDLKSFIGRPLVDTFAMHDPDTAQRLLEAYLEINIKLLNDDSLELFDGVMEELRALKKAGIKQGIVSSKRRESLDISLRNKGLTDFFDVLITKEDTKEHKPDPEPIVKCSEILGIPVDRMMYVGDAKVDIECAKNTGCASVFVDWSLMDKDEILRLSPDYIIKEMRELSCIIFDGEL